MKTLTLDVATPEQFFGAAARDAVRRRPTAPRHSFASPDVLWRVFTPNRWALLEALCRRGPVTVREAATLVGRDVKPVHADLTALRLAGLLQHTSKGQIEFPYDALKIEFMLKLGPPMADVAESTNDAGRAVELATRGTTQAAAAKIKRLTSRGVHPSKARRQRAA